MLNEPKSKISVELEGHYTRKFLEYGSTSQGVDWGPHLEDHTLRLEKMLSVSIGELNGASVLDVGCGFGSLLDLIKQKGLKVDYTGIDLSEPMIDEAIDRHSDASWIHGDILDLDGKKFDYVVCNGIFTQKLTASNRDMDRFLSDVVTRMFSMCKIGICFNVMTTHVNFISPNLYYRNPTELLAWAMTTLSPKVKIDHSYPMFEYTIYVYREEAKGVAYQSHRE